MGEVLRAILDFNSLDSRTAFYSVPFVTPLPATGSAFGRRQASIQCKQDVWFLAMGASLDAGFIAPGGPYLWENKSFAATFQIVRASTGEAFSLTSQTQSLQNYNLNNWVTWDEYIAFAPAELIQVNADIIVAAAGAGQTEFSFVTLMGVEYRMKNGSV